MKTAATKSKATRLGTFVTERRTKPGGGEKSTVHVLTPVSDDLALYHALRRIDESSNAWG